MCVYCVIVHTYLTISCASVCVCVCARACVCVSVCLCTVSLEEGPVKERSPHSLPVHLAVDHP